MVLPVLSALPASHSTRDAHNLTHQSAAGSNWTSSLQETSIPRCNIQHGRSRRTGRCSHSGLPSIRPAGVCILSQCRETAVRADTGDAPTAVILKSRVWHEVWSSCRQIRRVACPCMQSRVMLTPSIRAGFKPHATDCVNQVKDVARRGRIPGTCLCLVRRNSWSSAVAPRQRAWRMG